MAISDGKYSDIIEIKAQENLRLVIGFFDNEIVRYIGEEKGVSVPVGGEVVVDIVAHFLGTVTATPESALENQEFVVSWWARPFSNRYELHESRYSDFSNPIASFFLDTMATIPGKDSFDLSYYYRSRVLTGYGPGPWYSQGNSSIFIVEDVLDEGVWEPNGDPTLAVDISITTKIRGSIGYGVDEVDWIKILMPSSGEWKVQVKNLHSVDVASGKMGQVELYDENIDQLLGFIEERKLEPGLLETSAPILVHENTTYYIKIERYNETHSAPYRLKSTLEGISYPDIGEPNESYEKSSPIMANTDFSAQIGYGTDRYDWYEISPLANGTLTIQVTNLHSGLQPKGQMGNVSFFDASFNEMTAQIPSYNLDPGESQLVSFSVSLGQKYYIRFTSHYESNSFFAAPYQIKVDLEAPPCLSVFPSLPDGNYMEMVAVQEGYFTMGSNQGVSYEQPEHQVFLDSYFIGKYEVTAAQFVSFLAAIKDDKDTHGNHYLDDYGNTGMQIERNGDNFSLKDPEKANHPVIWVTWYGADAFCQWMDGRLPTEAEWEKAARGPDGRNYPWGNAAPNEQIANYSNLSDGSINTAPVGSYPGDVSPYCAHDMAGNVAERVADMWSSTYYEDSPERNPTGPASGSSSWVVRGGSWQEDSSHLFTWFRERAKKADALRQWGFRCVKDTN